MTSSLSTSVFLAFIHHVAAFALFGSVLFQHLTFKPGLTLNDAKRLARVDIVYGVSAVIVIIAGLLRVFYFEKGSAYYLHNAAFHTKMAVFVLVGLLSIYPTKVFLSWRKNLRHDIVPHISPRQLKRITMILRAEMLGLIIILFCAVLMAKGLG